MAFTPAAPLALPESTVTRHLLALSSVLTVVDPVLLQELVTESLASAVTELQKDSWVLLSPHTIVTRGTEGVDCDISEDYYDLDRPTYVRMGYWQTRHRPIIDVQAVTVEFGPGQPILNYPHNWMRIQHRLGHVQIVPLIGQVELTSLGGDYWLPLLNGGTMYGVLPQMVRIDYTAGIPDFATAPKWARARQMLGKRAAIDVVEGLTELIPTGDAIDGASTQIGNFQTRLDAYQREWEAYLKEFSEQEGVIHMGFA